MSRGRRAVKWEARAVPAARAGLMAEFHAVAETQLRQYHHAGEWLSNNAGTTDVDSVVRATADRAVAQELYGVNTEALEGAEVATLYWATSGQTRLAASAAVSLPAWSARQALPCPNGLILFEESVGSVRVDVQAADSPRVDVDGMLWRTREDDFLVVYLLSRYSGAGELRRARGVGEGKATVWPVTWLMCELSLVESPRERKSEEDSFLDLIGALWLLIGQDRVSTTETVETSKRRPRRRGSSSTGAEDEFERVVVVDLHRAQPAPVEVGDRAQPTYRHRWWVEGHWRQQACGPNMSERRPIFIFPHVKGPPDRPFKTDAERVYRLR